MLEAKIRMGRATQADLDGPPVPDELEYLWLWFLELERQRDVSERGLRPLSYSEIMAWALLTDRRVQPHEVNALVSLDLAARTPDA